MSELFLSKNTLEKNTEIFSPNCFVFNVPRSIFLLHVVKLGKKYVEIYKATQQLICMLSGVRHSVWQALWATTVYQPDMKLKESESHFLCSRCVKSSWGSGGCSGFRVKPWGHVDEVQGRFFFFFLFQKILNTSRRIF